jgi:hypothetical protein
MGIFDNKTTKEATQDVAAVAAFLGHHGTVSPFE